MKPLNRRAYTLVEVMVTAVIFSLVASGIYMTFIIGTRSWAYYNDSVILKQDVRRSFFAMCQELREARNIFFTTDDVKGVTIRFYRPDLGNISYTWSTRGENAYQIIRKNKDQKRVLATQISGLIFKQETTDDITIEVEAMKTHKDGKDIQFNLEAKVALRAKTGLLKHSEDAI